MDVEPVSLLQREEHTNSPKFAKKAQNTIFSHNEKKWTEYWKPYTFASLEIFTLQHARLYGVKFLQTVISILTDVRITNNNVNLLAIGWQTKFNSGTKCNRKHSCVTVLLRSLSKVSGVVMYAESHNLISRNFCTNIFCIVILQKLGE